MSILNRFIVFDDMEKADTTLCDKMDRSIENTMSHNQHSCAIRYCAHIDDLTAATQTHLCGTHRTRSRAC